MTPLPGVGIVTQARMTSTRLPGKVLKAAGGRSMLAHHLRRLEVAGLPVIVATTLNDTDDPVAEEARENGARVFRGSEDDVLSRFAGAAAAFGLTAVVRVTSDCPLIDGALVRRGAEEYVAAHDDALFVSNTLERTFPRGMDFEVFSAEALHRADAEAQEPFEREHVTPFLYREEGARHSAVTRAADASAYRVTLDTAEDLAALTALIEEHGAASLDAEGIIGVLEAHPEIVAMNAAVEQKKLGE